MRRFALIGTVLGAAVILAVISIVRGRLLAPAGIPAYGEISAGVIADAPPPLPVESDEPRTQVDVTGPDLNGRFKVRWVDVDAVEHELLVTPRGKIVPELSTVVTASTGSNYEYSYTIGNRISANDRLRRCRMDVAMPASNAYVPPGWIHFQPTAVAPSVVWASISRDVSVTIPPGGLAEPFRLASPNLPGVTTVTCLGSNSSGVVQPDDHPELPFDVDRAVGRILGQVEFKVSGIGPVIERSADRVAIVVERIAENYREPVLNSARQDRATIATALDAAVAHANEGDNPALRNDLSRIWQLLRVPAADAWSQELSAGLSLCVEYVQQRLRTTNSPPPSSPQ